MTSGGFVYSRKIQFDVSGGLSFFPPGPADVVAEDGRRVQAIKEEIRDNAESRNIALPC